MSEETAELRAEVRELRAELVGLRDLMEAAPPRHIRIARREGDATGGQQDTIFQTGTLLDRQAASDVNAVMLKPPQLLLFEQDGKWFGMDPTGDPDGDGGDGDSCECRLIEVLSTHDHLEDISDETWAGLREHCNCITLIACGVCVENKMPESWSVQADLSFVYALAGGVGDQVQAALDAVHKIKLDGCAGTAVLLETETTVENPSFPIGTPVRVDVFYNAFFEDFEQPTGNVFRLRYQVQYSTNTIAMDMRRDTEFLADPGDLIPCSTPQSLNKDNFQNDTGDSTWNSPAIATPAATDPDPPPP